MLVLPFDLIIPQIVVFVNYNTDGSIQYWIGSFDELQPTFSFVNVTFGGGRVFSGRTFVLLDLQPSKIVS